MKKYITKKNILRLGTSLVLVFIAFVVTSHNAQASLASGAVDTILSVVNYILSWVVQGAAALGSYLATWMMQYIIALASYNNFIFAEPVKNGWVIMRDLANMVFVVGMLYIAFMTVFQGTSSYKWGKSLLSLVIMALLVNFSLFICGLAIDAGQVVMLTFVHAFQEIGVGNLMASFGVEEYFKLARNVDGTIEGATKEQFQFGMYLGLLTVIVLTVITLGAYVIVLLERTVMLWILVAISPLAFALFAIDKGKKYASEWIQKFTSYILMGPVLAFFLWLSFHTFTSLTSAAKEFNTEAFQGSPQFGEKFLKPDFLSGFALVIAFMFAGLVMSRKLGSIGGQMGMQWASKAKAKGIQYSKKAAKLPYRAAKSVAKPYVAGAVQGVSDRLQTKGFGRVSPKYTRLLTKEGRKRFQSQQQQSVRSGVGPLKLAGEREMQKQMEYEKQLQEDSGVFQGKKPAKKALNKSIENKDYRPARAQLEKSLELGFLNESDVRKFLKTFEDQLGGEDSKQYYDFTENLEKIYKKGTGRTMALNDLQIDEEGQISSREDYDKKAEYELAYGKRKPAERGELMEDTGHANTTKVTSDLDKENAFYELVAISREYESMGNPAVSKTGRENMADAYEGLVKEDYSLLKERVEKGEVSQKDLDNMIEGYLRTGARFQANGQLEEGFDLEQDSQYDPAVLEKMKKLKESTKHGVAHEMRNDMKNVGALDVTNDNSITDISYGGADGGDPGVGLDDSGNVLTRNTMLEKDKRDLRIASAIHNKYKSGNGNPPAGESDSTTRENIAIELARIDGVNRSGMSADDRNTYDNSVEVNKLLSRAKNGQYRESKLKKKGREFEGVYANRTEKISAIVKDAEESKKYKERTNELSTARISVDPNIKTYDTAINTAKNSRKSAISAAQTKADPEEQNKAIAAAKQAYEAKIEQIQDDFDSSVTPDTMQTFVESVINKTEVVVQRAGKFKRVSEDRNYKVTTKFENHVNVIKKTQKQLENATNSADKMKFEKILKSSMGELEKMMRNATNASAEAIKKRKP